MPRVFGPGIHLSAPGNTQSPQMRLRQQLTGKPISAIQPKGLSIHCVSSVGGITWIMEQVCPAISLFIFFPACILSLIHWAQIKSILPVTCDNVNMDAKCMMYCWGLFVDSMNI